MNRGIVQGVPLQVSQSVAFLTTLCLRVRAVNSDTDLTEEELEEKMEQFMRSQADRESGKVLLSSLLLGQCPGSF